MASKRYLHHLWSKLRPISHWYFLVAAILCAVIAVGALRQNNLRMVELRQAVTVADESGEGVDVALNELREHVYAHMNTDLTSGGNAIYPPIQLKNTYERLTQDERDRVAAINKKVSADAVRICEARYPAGQLRNGRVQCVQKYITENSVQENFDDVPKELYQFAFVSPAWSPDLAGFSLLAAIVFFLFFVLRLGLGLWLKHQFHEHD